MTTLLPPAPSEGAIATRRAPAERATAARLAALLCAFATFGAAPRCTAAGDADAAIPPDHPLLGSWTWTVPTNGCTERYSYRANGTMLATSGEQVVQTTYRVSFRPSAKEFYRIDEKVSTDNAKQDCTDQPPHDTTGEQNTIYARFDRTGNAMVMCRDESMNACFGPLRRVELEEAHAGPPARRS